MTRCRLLLAGAAGLGLGLVTAGPLAAQSPPSPSPAPSASPQAPPCSTPEHRQFDFWIGDWNVRNPQGRLAGTNRITKEYGGCVLQEHWEAAGGGHTGSSFNVYRPGSGRWHQTWVDTSGTLLLLDGGFEGGKLQLTGETPTGPGRKTLHQLSFEPLPDGRVHQLWKSSGDDGRTWNVVFDGYYERKP